MRTEIWVLVVTSLAGCKAELKSIAPHEHLEAALALPAYDHDYFAIAQLDVPEGYELLQTDKLDFEVERRRRDPRVRVRTSHSRDASSHVPDPGRLFQCETSEWSTDRVLRREVRNDGELVICEGRDVNTAALQDTAVLRTYRWHDTLFQCAVVFEVHPDLDVPYDEGKPSEARLADAIAICDSFSIREMREDETDRFFPPPPGTLHHFPMPTH